MITGTNGMVLVAISAMFAGNVAIEEPSGTPGTALTFVEGEPFGGNVDQSVRGLPTLVATFETSPVNLYNLGLLYNALANSLFTETLRELPLTPATFDSLVQSRMGEEPRSVQLIKRQVLYGSDGTPSGIRWRVFAVSEEMAKMVSRAVIDKLRSMQSGRVTELRQRLEHDLPLVARESEIKSLEKELAVATAAAVKQGMARLDTASLQAGSAALAQEIRMLEVDIRGLEARMHTARRLKTEQVAPSGDGVKTGDVSPIAIRLSEMIVEIQIDLAGNLERRSVLHTQLAQLDRARKHQQRVEQLEAKLIGMRVQWDMMTEQVKQLHHEIAIQEKDKLAVVDNKVTISPILHATAPRKGSPE